MRRSALVLAVFVVLAGILGACSPSPLAAQGQTQPLPYTIQANGTGKVYLTPDLAYVSFGVHTESATVSEALRQNNAQSQAVAKTLNEAGIKPEDIQTSAFNVLPQQQYDDKGEPTKTVYVVDNIVYVTVRDLGKLGQMLDAVVSAGVNTVNSINFDVQDKSKALSEARRLAVEDAKAQAKELADVSGVKLGKVTSLNVFLNNAGTPLYDVKVKNSVGGASVPIAAGQLLIQMDASLSYEIVQ